MRCWPSIRPNSWLPWDTSKLPPTLRSMQHGSALPRLEFQMLWQQVLGVPRSWLIGHDTDPLSEQQIQQFQQLQARRLAGEPMAYILGQREFMGHVFSVSDAVLIPRPETELLVETALNFLQQQGPCRVLDLGTGSGAIAISVALACPQACVVATDFSAEALAVAQTNADALGARIQFLQGSWYDALTDNKGFDLILSNPPYIAACDPHLRQGDVRYEPLSALTDHADGTDALQRIIQGAGVRLTPGGALFLEHGWDQAASVRELLTTAGFKRVLSLSDLADIPRVTGGYF